MCTKCLLIELLKKPYCKLISLLSMMIAGNSQWKIYKSLHSYTLGPNHWSIIMVFESMFLCKSFFLSFFFCFSFLATVAYTCDCIWWTLPLLWWSLYLAYSGRVQYHDFLRVLRLKACPLSAKVSYQIARDFFNIVGLKSLKIWCSDPYILLNSLIPCAWHGLRWVIIRILQYYVYL